MSQEVYCMFSATGQGWVAQVSFRGGDPPSTHEKTRDFIKTFEIKSTPECYLPYIRENFQANVGQLASGLVALNLGEYSTALESLRPLAERDYPQAQNALGSIYEEGLGITTNYYEAAKWYKLAADQGDSSAQFSLGRFYEFGRGIAKDYSKAAKWYLESAEQNNPNAQHNLGLLFSSGEGVRQDDIEALRWFTRAAEQGILQAQYNAGVSYDEGLGVPEDDKEAARWYLLAATQGFYPAQIRIAYMYLEGEGVQQDYIEAFAWCHVASQSDAVHDATVTESRDWVTTQLPFWKLRAARKRAEELMQMVMQ
jgi:TPR repeat protein